MQIFSVHPRAMLLSIWQHRELIKVSTRREVLGRYRGSMAGLLWSFITPVFMLLIFTFVFSVVFSARWGSGGESKTQFALLLFVGLIQFNLFAECVNRAPGIISANVNYVKKVIFPLEILPVVALLSALFHASVSLLVWILAYLFFEGLPSITLLWLPLVMFPYVLLLLGLLWMLSSSGVYLRDIVQLVGVMTTALMFLSPVFYPVTALPEQYQFLFYLNPLTPVIEQSRLVLFYGQSPVVSILMLYWGVGLVVAWLGFVWFQKTRKGFADVL